MSKVGFGGYRISNRSSEHKEALKHALENGLKVIDTSSNYTNGESETLIGEVLKENFLFNPVVISKVGYIQGDNLEVLAELNKEGKTESEIVDISPDLKHSIHPEFIEDQVNRSLKRLGLKSIDIYLLHNPEYYLKTEGSSKPEYYRRIQQAFIKLEELVERGLIKSYGISSNTFVDPKEDHESTDFDMVFQLAKDFGEHHFKYIQFPMNVIEMGALERQFEGSHLIERAQELGVKTIINRPLNCFSDHGLLRLAVYPVDELYTDHKNADEIFNRCIEPLVVKWLEVREDEGDKLFDLPIMKQISSIWFKQNSKDAVDQVFFQYFFPLVASIWGRDLTPEESQQFYDLYEHAQQFALANMNERAKMFEQQALDKGLLFESEKTLSQKVIEKYASFGVDYILVGMRKKAYVDDLKEYF